MAADQPARTLVVFAAMALLLQVCLILLSFTGARSPRLVQWLYAPSLLLAWGGYAYYETVYIPANCPGDCAIRVDLLLIYPYLAFVTIAALAYFARKPPGAAARGRRSA